MSRIVLAVVLAALAAPAPAQQALLDQPVKAGELTLFPDLNDATRFYYVSDKPRLALDAQGRPQFSFLRWVDDQRTSPDQPDAREGEGAGIVHAVVSLAVTPEQLQQARQELQRVRPGGTIQGPMVYRSGRFALVAAVTDPAGGLSSKVLGLGKAPVLDGEKAAVSILLTKQGAKILWESFATPAPDISFSFEMELPGFRSPHRGIIEADFDQIYQHQDFAAGIASNYLAAEIKATFDDLTRKNAIKVTQIGSDEKMETLISTAYDKLLTMMFSPIEGTGTPSIASLQGMGGQPSLLDRATTMLDRSRAEARASSAGATSSTGTTATGTTATGTTATPAATPTGTVATGTGTTTPTGTTATPAGDTPPADGRPRVPATARGTVTPPSDSSATAGARLAGDPSPGAPQQPRSEASAPSFAVVAAFEMKTVRQRGIFRIDLNKFTAESLTLRFDENIGDLRALRGDNTFFRQVNLDDPFFRKREIAVSVDGLNADDFGRFVNGVTVHLRKVHATGEVSDEEVAIRRENFTNGGNAFKLVYGWKNDNDRRRWLDYEYQVTWSFFGGVQVAVPAQRTTQGLIVLSPPFQRRTVEVQGDPAALAAAQVRSVTVRLWYRLAGREQMQQLTLDPAKGRLSDRFEILLPADSFAYDYEIAWRMSGNRSGTTGRRSGQDAILFVDDVVSP